MKLQTLQHSLLHRPISRRAAILLAAFGTPALSQDLSGRWPSKTLRIIVPYPAGGTPDSLARQMGEQLTASLGVPAIIENRPGASGVLGVRAMTSQPLDGHTLVLISSGHVTATALSPNFDLLRETRVVTRLTNSPLLLVVNAASPYTSLSELIKGIKDKPGVLTYGSAGPGSAPHMAVELLTEMVPGMKALHVPYKGTVEFANAILAKDLDFAFGISGVLLPLIKSGRLRALGTSTRVRVEQLPDLPTISEAGVSGYNFGAWLGIAVHKDTPEPVLQQLHNALAQAATKDAFNRLLQQTATQLDLSESPRAFSSAIEREVAKERVTVKRLGLSVQS